MLSLEGEKLRQLGRGGEKDGGEEGHRKRHLV
jgi:hypothetical protein